MPDSPATSFSLESVAWNDPRAVTLRAVMDVDMHGRYGDVFDGDDPGRAREVETALAINPDDIIDTVIGVDAATGAPLGHAALRLLRGEWEVKRVIVDPAARGRGVAIALMNELQRLAEVAGRHRIILQTGDRQPEAVALYEKLGYTRIPIYEPYIEAIPMSICFEKLF